MHCNCRLSECDTRVSSFRGQQNRTEGFRNQGLTPPHKRPNAANKIACSPFVAAVPASARRALPRSSAGPSARRLARQLLLFALIFCCCTTRPSSVLRALCGGLPIHSLHNPPTVFSVNDFCTHCLPFLYTQTHQTFQRAKLQT